MSLRARACPRDQTPLVANKVRVFGPDVTVDNCPRCEGVFLDKNELMRLTGDRELNAYLRDHTGYDVDSEMLCPSCGGLMDAERSGDVEVEVCLTCFGLWLDKGELESLRARKNSDRIHHDDAKARELAVQRTRDMERRKGEYKRAGLLGAVKPIDDLLDEIVRRWL